MGDKPVAQCVMMSVAESSVVDPKFVCPGPDSDMALTLISDPDCLSQKHLNCMCVSMRVGFAMSP